MADEDPGEGGDFQPVAEFIKVAGIEKAGGVQGNEGAADDGEGPIAVFIEEPRQQGDGAGIGKQNGPKGKRIPVALARNADALNGE